MNPVRPNPQDQEYGKLVSPMPPPKRIIQARTMPAVKGPGATDYSGNFNVPVRDDLSRRRQEWQQKPLTAAEKDRLYARKKQLETVVIAGMPTHTEMWKATPENVSKLQRWEREFGPQIRELKQINRRLEPDNPHAGRIEYLRKQGEADKLARWS